MAADQLNGEWREHTLQTTALVHEAYLRLARQHAVEWLDRPRILGAAAEFMRRILVDHARRRNALKRPPPGLKVAWRDVACSDTDEQDFDLVALDDALRRLEQISPRQAQTVVLRFFGGLSIEEVAQHLQTSVATINRDWKVARAWLYRELQM